MSATQERTSWKATAVGMGVTLERVARYLPSNFHCHAEVSFDGVADVIVTGTDVAGWTLHDYVQPRLESGGIFLEDVTQEGRAS